MQKVGRSFRYSGSLALDGIPKSNRERCQLINLLDPGETKATTVVQRQLHLPIDDNYTYPFLMTIISLPRVLNLRMGATEVAPL